MVLLLTTLKHINLIYQPRIFPEWNEKHTHMCIGIYSCLSFDIVR